MQITIGRVEVRATVAGARRPAAAPPAARPANILTLEEHLNRRTRRERS